MVVLGPARQVSGLAAPSGRQDAHLYARTQQCPSDLDRMAPPAVGIRELIGEEANAHYALRTAIYTVVPASTGVSAAGVWLSTSPTLTLSRAARGTSLGP